MQYSLQKQKALGAFYTPSSLSEYLAKQTLSMKKNEKDKEYVVLDPAVGESALLYAFLSESKRKGLHTGYVGKSNAFNGEKNFYDHIEHTCYSICKDQAHIALDASISPHLSIYISKQADAKYAYHRYTHLLKYACI